MKSIHCQFYYAPGREHIVAVHAGPVERVRPWAVERVKPGTPRARLLFQKLRQAVDGREAKV